MISQSETEQLVHSFTKIIIQNFSKFGVPCRRFMINHQEQFQDDEESNSQEEDQGQSSSQYQYSNASSQPDHQEDDSEPEEEVAPRVKRKYTKRQKKMVKEIKIKKKLKKVKHADRPKRPRNVYNLFVEDELGKIKKQNPHMRATELVKIAAERYNRLTEDQKRPYQKKYQIQKKIFDRNRQEFFKKHPEQDYRYQPKKQYNARVNQAEEPDTTTFEVEEDSEYANRNDEEEEPANQQQDPYGRVHVDYGRMGYSSRSDRSQSNYQ